MASAIYNKWKEGTLNGGAIDFDTDTLKVALVTSSYTPNFDTHDFFDDVTSEVTGTGYTAGGATLGTATVTLDTTNDWVTFDAADTVWSTATITARAAVLYKSTGTASTSRLVAYLDFGSDVTSTAADFTITWHSNGILRLA